MGSPIPEVIPNCCGDCKYFVKTGTLDRYKGKCIFYNVSRYSSFDCYVYGLIREGQIKKQDVYELIEYGQIKRQDGVPFTRKDLDSVLEPRSAISTMLTTGGPYDQGAPAPSSQTTGVIGACGFLGILIGGFIGFLLRPSVPFVGQLDFGTVIIRGANLRGIDQLLVSTAETSFNYMLAGLIIGGVGGVLVGYLASKRKGVSATVVTNQNKIEPVTPKSVELGQSPEQVQAVFGKPEKIINLGVKTVYVYKDMKIIFTDGKVADVQ